MSRRRSGTWVRWCLVVFAVVSALCVCGPALYWKFEKGTVMRSRTATACPLCDCHSQCPPPLSLFQIAPGLVNLAIPGQQQSSLLSVLLVILGSKTKHKKSNTQIFTIFQKPSTILKQVLLYCGKNDSGLNKEMEKQLADLLSEEIKLQEAVAEENFNRMNVTLGEARRLGLQYQREAEKCNAATETCEQARERSEALMTKERKLTSMWEQRARQLGWEGE